MCGEKNGGSVEGAHCGQEAGIHCIDRFSVVRAGNITSPAKVERGLADGPWSLSDHGKKCELKLKSNPYDLESWNMLVREAQVCSKIYLQCICTYVNVVFQATSLLRARMLYERLVTQFPTSGRYWRLYIEHEVNAMWSLWFSIFSVTCMNHWYSVSTLNISFALDWRKSMSALRYLPYMIFTLDSKLTLRRCVS